ncbi:MAG: S8 family serine peptidase, partial [Kiritimatiellae bacterium]|nr:S8 family serine peptidase [Kiritimatiellia bacterium]
MQWGTIDTSSADAQAESASLQAKIAKKAALDRRRRVAAPARAAYIVQFPGPVTEEWRTWLESATQVRGYLPEFAYLVWATAAEMETIAANPDVFWTGEWKKDYKTVRVGSAPAASSSAKSAAPARWMQVGSLLTDAAGAADLRARLEALPADVRSAFPRIDGVSAVAFLTDAQIDKVASWSDVEWIEPQLKPRPFNDKAALPNMMNVAPAWEAVSDGGLGLTGAGQVVAIADTGCDMGSTNDIHADFAGRVKAGYGWTNKVYKPSASWADLSGHGTHVCGSVLGSGAASTNLYRGMAWEAKLVVQGCGADLNGIPDDPFELLKQAHQVAGAYIHSDSWGYGPEQAGQYTATEIDDEGVTHYIYASMYVDGYMWTNQNFIMVISAGNNGVDTNADGVVDPGSVIPPGTAKNCICVGAAENYRSFTNTWGAAAPDLYPAEPIKSSPISTTATP